jgi:ribosomal protein S18 acetylase RimI-like enzyme
MDRTTRIARLLLAASYQIVRVDPEEDWETAEQVDQIANKVRIRPDSTKNVGFAAVMEDRVVGGAYIGITPDDQVDQPEPSFVYSFDVVVDPDFRWGRKIGLDLIKACEKDRRFYENENYGNIRTRLWVINPKLARYLEEREGYEVESQYEDGSAHLTKW